MMAVLRALTLIDCSYTMVRHNYNNKYNTTNKKQKQQAAQARAMSIICMPQIAIAIKRKAGYFDEGEDIAETRCKITALSMNDMQT